MSEDDVLQLAFHAELAYDSQGDIVTAWREDHDIRRYILAFATLIRDAALEEAARCCDRGADQMATKHMRDGAARCAAAIRAKKGPAVTQHGGA